MPQNPNRQLIEAVHTHSRFLSEEIAKRPEWIDEIVGNKELYKSYDVDDLKQRLDAAIAPGVPSGVALARFRRRQLLRILVRDVFARASLAETTEELSDTASAIVDCAYRRIRGALAERHGNPDSEFSVIALGKLGGRELNYSSDIDLMFVYSANGETPGPEQISHAEFFRKLSHQLTALLSTYTPEGMCYRVDLRLRPDGRTGEVCMSLDGATQYYANRARDWELQMLIKARVVAGEPGPGLHLFEAVEPKIYSSTLDFSSVEAVSVTRERISEKFAAKRSAGVAGLDIKLVPGGIRDIEFLVQCLQRLHGGREPWVRHGGTMLALTRLADKHLISSAEYARLTGAYQFLRHLEHRLQFEDDRQTHSLPTDEDDLETLAQKMPRSELGRSTSAAKLLRELHAHLEGVRETYERIIHSQQPLYHASLEASASELLYDTAASTNLLRSLDRRAPALANVLNARPVHRSGAALEAFLEKVLADESLWRILNRNPQVMSCILEVFEASPYFGEELVRSPGALAALAEGDISHDLSEPAELRIYFRTKMLQIQFASICSSCEIFDTLGQTSDLADCVIRSAYQIAIRQVVEAHPPERADYQPEDQMMVIALGRLGMREFDLGSDADLNFVLPDEDAGEIRFWTRVAERLVNIISAYTGEGVIFSVDTRLRPNGRAGILVQTAGAWCEYLERRAEVWEGITYMKSRCIAGNSARSREFLHELQHVDWRRYGQSGRSISELRSMRLRLEREQGESNPLKAGPGGYYDIDFALMYLRLRSAGIFFPVLNTPERIEIVEQLGHLSRPDAQFLRYAATLYRAIDHGLRLYSGHAQGRLPSSTTQLETLTELVRRWSPESEPQASLATELDEVRRKTREFFRRVFGTEGIQAPRG